MRRLLAPVDRLCALTDGVYAIVITLLVLDLKVPEGDAGPELAADLAAQFPNIVAYLISFAVAARFWLWHHGTFLMVTHCDRRLAALNILHLFTLTLIPFTSSLVGQYDNQWLAVSVFSANIGLVGLTMAALGHHARRGCELVPDADDRRELRGRAIRGLGVPVTAAISILAAVLWQPDAGLYAWLLNPLVLRPVGWLADRTGRKAEP